MAAENSENRICVMTGKESFADRSAMAQVYVIPRPAQIFQETPIWSEASLREFGLARRITSRKFPIGEDMRSDAGGWIVGEYAVPDGLLLKLVVNRHLSWSGQKFRGSVFFLTGQEAPNIEVLYKLSESERATFRHGRLSGRMHRLTLEEAETMLRDPIPPAFRGQFAENRVNEILHNVVVLQEGAARPALRVETVQVNNEDVVITSRRRRRKITF